MNQSRQILVEEIMESFGSLKTSLAALERAAGVSAYRALKRQIEGEVDAPAS